VARLKELLSSGEVIRLFGVGQLANHKIVQILGLLGGYHGIWIDQEHAGVTLREIETLALACRAHGLDSIVRVEPVHYAAIMRPLEAGAGGIMAAQIRTVQDAREVVRWAKFWPEGQRGINGGGADGHFGMKPLADYAEQANREVAVAIQIETIDAIENLPELVKIRGIDLFFVGPSDLAQSLGLIGEFDHPRCFDTIEYVAQVCNEAGKPWGIVARSPDYARHWRERGCRVFMVGNDIIAFRRGVENLLASFEQVVTKHSPGAPAGEE